MNFTLDGGVLSEVWSVISGFFSLFTGTSLGYLVITLIVVTSISFIFGIIGGR